MNICMNCGKEYRSLEQLVEQRYCLSCETEMRNSRNDNKPPELTEEEKLLPSLNLNSLYSRIYDWHQKNHNAILKTSNRPDYIKQYRKLFNELPQPASASENDIAFVGWEVLNGLMEWSYGKIDGHDIQMMSYARLIGAKIGEAFQIRRHQSRMYPLFH